MSEEGFLSRWSRRKAEVKSGAEAEPEPPAEVASVQPAAPEPIPEPPAPDPPPTMDDVAELTTASDFTRFVTREVDPAVKNAALKKLFADPHFNVMDGLDTYIDDYNTPDPLPESMLRKMVQAEFLGLFKEENKEEKAQTAPPKASPDGAAAPAVPQSSVDPSAVPPDEDPDLRLQQDDAARPGGAGEGPSA